MLKRLISRKASRRYEKMVSADEHNFQRLVIAFADPKVLSALGAGSALHSVEEMVAKIKNRIPIPENNIAWLEAQLGPDGAPLTHQIRVLNTSNKLKKMGYWNDTTKTFRGGVLSTLLGAGHPMDVFLKRFQTR